jgi:cholesterol transport system auxiliary component
MKAAWVLFIAGCAFLSKSSPVEVRYFSPESLVPPTAREPTCSAGLRLGRFRRAEHLENRIAHRESAVELGLSDTRRWTEQPDDYVRRSLTRQLFEVRGLVQTTSGRDPTLDVEVLGFEEATIAGRHTGRVQLSYQLRGDSAITRGELVKERPVQGTGFDAVVTAIGEAMTDATSELASRVATSLCSQQPN